MDSRCFTDVNLTSLLGPLLGSFVAFKRPCAHKNRQVAYSMHTVLCFGRENEGP